MHLPLLKQLSLAYIDPAAGTLLLQTLIGGALGAVAFFRRSIAQAFRRLFGRKDPGPGGPGAGNA